MSRGGLDGRLGRDAVRAALAGVAAREPAVGSTRNGLKFPDLIDPSGELSSEELEAVAGGSDCWFTCGNTCQGCSNSITTEAIA